MDWTYIISFIVLYLIISWMIGFNAIHEERFTQLDKKSIIGFLLLPPIGIILFLILKLSRKNDLKKRRIRKSKKIENKIYLGSYQGGHNRPAK